MKLLAVSGECLRVLMPVILSLDTKLGSKILVVLCDVIFVCGGGGVVWELRGMNWYKD